MKRSGEMPNSDVKSSLLKNVSVTDQLAPLDLRHVNVGGEMGRRIDVTFRRNLLMLEVDKDFIAPFRCKESSDYVGLGKLIDAAVNFAAYTNHAEIVSLKDHMIRETIKTQSADGYIGTMKPMDRMQKEYDTHEMAYIVFGLASNYRQYGNEESGKAAVNLANYIINNWAGANEKLTTLGLEEGFMALSNVTGDSAYLDFCAGTKMGWRIGYSTLREWRRPVKGHVYRYLARCLTQVDLHRVESESSLLKQAWHALEFLTSCDGLVITGTCSHKEYWHEDQNGAGHLGETCATAYLIRLLDSMIRLEGALRYGDIMERSIHNALFAAQSSDGRHLRYFTPFEGKRVYFDEDLIELSSHDTYCCPNNFRRIVAELPSKIYYKYNSGLAVNLYVSSTAKVELAGQVSLTVRQETDYPNSGHVAIYLSPSESSIFPVQLRIPRWCSQGQIAVNGKPTNESIVGGQFFEITRKWEAGDCIALDMPMPWRIVEGRKTQKGRVAVMRGPIVYCLSSERNNGLSGVDLRKITIDPLSLEGPTKDDIVRPDGLKCRVRAWSDGRNLKQSPDLNLYLTEFPDPTGEAIYFFVPSLDIAVHDELMAAD